MTEIHKLDDFESMRDCLRQSIKHALEHDLDDLVTTGQFLLTCITQVTEGHSINYMQYYLKGMELGVFKENNHGLAIFRRIMEINYNLPKI